MREQEVRNLWEAYLEVCENQQLDEVSDELVGRSVNARIARSGAANDAEMKDRTPENMRNSVRAGEKEASMKTAAAKRKKRINKEEVETWVNSLIEEGYDLSDYTWEEMYETYANLNEGRTTSLSALSRESQKRKDDKKRGRPETESETHSRLAMGKFRPGASQEERAEGGRQVLKDRGKVPKKGGKDMFEHILEHLVAEGYADTNEAALAIMANMSEEWRQSIVEEVFDEALTGERYKKVMNKPGGTAYSRKVSADPSKRATRGGRGGESDFGAGDRGSGNKAARRAGTYKED
jgi:hypothetical protein